MKFNILFKELIQEANIPKRKKYLKEKYKNSSRFPRYGNADIIRPVSPHTRQVMINTYDHIFHELGMAWLEQAKMEKDFEDCNESNILTYVEFWNNYVIDHVINKVVDKIDPCQGKYSDWILNRILDEHKFTTYSYGRFIKEDGETRLRPLLQIYDRYKDRIRKAVEEFINSDTLPTEIRANLFKNWENINSFPSIGAFESFTKIFPKIFEEGLNEDEKNKAKKEVEKIYESENWLILIPKTELAARVYGMGTRWCTAAKKNSRFDYYNKMGPLYILINKKTDEKFQFHYESDQFMDATDTPIDYDDFYIKHRDLQDILGRLWGLYLRDHG